MNIYSLLRQPAKAVLKHPQSRRFATILRPADDAKRLDCGGSPPLFHRAAMAAVIYLLAFGAMAQTTNDLSGMEIRGRQLAQQLLEQRPVESFTNTGVLQIRGAKGGRSNVPVKCEVIAPATNSNWESIYEASATNQSVKLVVIHGANQVNEYFYATNSAIEIPILGDIPMLGHLFHSHQLTGSQTLTPFAGSDFWLADLGLEFFHWPDQKILKGETMSGRFCKVLESTNPDPPTNGYSRVVSWIDNESLGIVQAKAYDTKGKLLKSFYPKDVKKVDGQWQVGSMTIDNIQTGSRTKLIFDLKK
jgi:hypothetical protein